MSIECHDEVHSPHRKQSDSYRCMCSTLPVHHDYWSFITDDRDSLLRDMHVLYLMRGLSGSGKSSLVERICRKHVEHVIASADHHFIVAKDQDWRDCASPDLSGSNLQYGFDVTKLAVAHRECRAKAEEAMKMRVRAVIVDNTNIEWNREIYPYVQLARTYKYLVVIVEARNAWSFCPLHLSQRSRHGVRATQIAKRLRVYRPVRPSYFAIFLNDQDSRLLKLKAFDLSRMLLPDINFQDPRRSHVNMTLHCTMFFANAKERGIEETSSLVCKFNEEVGRVFDITVVGFFFSRNCISARASLRNSKAKRLWLQDDDVEGSVNGETCVESVLHPSCGVGRRAHLTLWTAESVRPVQAGLEACKQILDEHEAKPVSKYLEICDLTRPDLAGMLCETQTGEAYSMYLDKPITFQGVLMAGY